MDFLWNTKDDILKNVGNQTFLVTIDFYCTDKERHLKKKCFPQKKENNLDLDWHEGK